MFIYLLKDPITNQVRYIGQTVKKRPTDRYSAHLCLAKKGTKTHLYNWIRGLLSNGLKPVLEPVLKCANKEELNYWEVFLIKSFRNLGFNLCNGTDGGDGTCGVNRKGTNLGRKISEETKKHLSEINKGKSYSDEYKQKMSDALKGKNTKKVLCVTTGIIFDSVQAAAVSIGVHYGSISRVVKENRKVKGFEFKYLSN